MIESSDGNAKVNINNNSGKKVLGKTDTVKNEEPSTISAEKKRAESEKSSGEQNALEKESIFEKILNVLKKLLFQD